MFTGIVTAVGKIHSIAPIGGDQRFTLELGELSEEHIALGDSMAVNGVCLTAIDLPAGFFVADVSNETLDCTTLGDLSPGSPVNLELALQPTSRLGGHLVSGHVDGVGVLIKRYPEGRSERYEFEAPADIARYIAAKGSITIDGTSLTVNKVDGRRFDVNLIPHTQANTVAGTYKPGATVNLEVDLIARYVERLLSGGGGDRGPDFEMLLADSGLVTRGA